MKNLIEKLNENKVVFRDSENGTDIYLNDQLFKGSSYRGLLIYNTRMKDIENGLLGINFGSYLKCFKNEIEIYHCNILTSETSYSAKSQQIYYNLTKFLPQEITPENLCLEVKEMEINRLKAVLRNNDKIEVIKSLRKDLGWSQVELSKQLSIPKRTIEEWERGSRTPSDWTINLIIDKLIDIKNNRKTYKDNGLLKSAAIFLSSNSTNPDVYKLLAESPKYKAKYHIGKTFDNGISCIDMELIDESYLPGVKYVPESELDGFMKNI